MRMGCADLCLWTENDNGPEFHVVRVVRAAKAHRCCECRDAIAVGEQHEVVSGKWEGHFDTFRTCLACVEIRTTFACSGWTYTTLWEDIADQMFPDWSHNLMGVECLAKLKTPEAERKMRDRYARYAHDNDLSPTGPDDARDA